MTSAADVRHLQTAGCCDFVKKFSKNNLDICLQLVVTLFVFGFFKSGAVDTAGFQELGESVESPLAVVVDDLKEEK